MIGRGRAHHAFAPDPPLSLKCMLNCRARYRIDRGEFVVDDAGYLILNEHQPYEIAIEPLAARGLAESFILWFPPGWASDVARVRAGAHRALLDAPQTGAAEAPQFFERYRRHDDVVSPTIRALCDAHRTRHLDDFWLEERLRDLLERMLDAQAGCAREPLRITAVRASTRAELWRRVNRARDFIHARSPGLLTLAGVAQACGLSPYHLHRTFKAVFGRTPHAWLMECRLAHAKSLLAHTTASVTEICAQVGFESLGSFSAWFSRAAGGSPKAWRRSHGRRSAIRKFREVSSNADMLSSAAPP